MDRLTIATLILLASGTTVFGQQSMECSNCRDSISWRDADGSKVIRINVIKRGVIGAKGWDNQISATYALNAKDTFRTVNSIKEAAREMDAILYYSNKITLIDVDGNGTKEGYFFYEIAVDGLDDNTLKLICFCGNNKIVVSGNLPKSSERLKKVSYVTKNTIGLNPSVVDHLKMIWKKENNRRAKEYISILE